MNGLRAQRMRYIVAVKWDFFDESQQQAVQDWFMRPLDTRLAS